MSAHLQPQLESLKAAADLSEKPFRIVSKDGTTRKVNVTGDAEKGYGVLQGGKHGLGQAGPNTDELGEVAVAGGALVKVSGSVSAGDSVASAAEGKGRTAVAGEWAVGVFDEDAVDGDIVSIRVFVHQLAQSA